MKPKLMLCIFLVIFIILIILLRNNSNNEKDISELKNTYYDEDGIEYIKVYNKETKKLENVLMYDFSDSPMEIEE